MDIKFGKVIRKFLTPGIFTILLVVFYVISTINVEVPSAQIVATRYHFKERPIALPPGYDRLPKSYVRELNPGYFKIRSWVSSVGASVAANDFWGRGRSDGLCIVDTRTNKVFLTYTPNAPLQDRFTPFILDPSQALPMDSTMAPTSCTPGDFNNDGAMDFLVTYWGRTPIIFLANRSAHTIAPSTYRPIEVVPSAVYSDHKYTGELWNTETVSVADFNGDGKPDLIFGNYFPQSGVLDPEGGRNDVYMNNSMSHAFNGGGERVFRWIKNSADGSPEYVEDKDAIPYNIASGWTLGLASGDLNGDGLPELYVANDFGRDLLLYNVSTPKKIKFINTHGYRTPLTPKSFVLGNDSFKGMGADFIDLDARGKYDIIVSNITMPFGLEESNFVWSNDSSNDKDMTQQLAAGHAPFTQKAQEYGLAWTGWSWDIKSADLTNSSYPDILQTDGFIQGNRRKERWAWLQELATENDVLLREPSMWPNFQPGDDLSGHEKLALYSRVNGKNKYTNIGAFAGITDDLPTRGTAPADTLGTGVLDFAVARQWASPVFYQNVSPHIGKSLSLTLYRPDFLSHTPGSIAAPGTPAYGAEVLLYLPDGRKRINQLDGGSGDGGRRDFTVHFGLGKDIQPVKVDIRWRTLDGLKHEQTITLKPGHHILMLSDNIKEI